MKNDSKKWFLRLLESVRITISIHLWHSSLFVIHFSRWGLTLVSFFSLINLSIYSRLDEKNIGPKILVQTIQKETLPLIINISYSYQLKTLLGICYDARTVLTSMCRVVVLFCPEDTLSWKSATTSGSDILSTCFSF